MVGQIVSVSSFFAEKRTDTNNPTNNPKKTIDRATAIHRRA